MEILKRKRVFSLNSEFNLGRNLKIYAKDILVFSKTKESLIQRCLINMEVDLRAYNYIESNALLNLRPEINFYRNKINFQSSINLQIEAALDPAFLPEIIELIENSNEEVVDCVKKPGHEWFSYPLSSPHSWYALEVKQKQKTGEVGYRTLWYYLDPSDITSNGIDPEKMNQAMIDFAKEWEGQPASKAFDENIISDQINEMTQTLERLSDDLSQTTQNVVSETVEEIAQVFEELTNSFSEGIEEIEATETDIAVYDALIDFFKAENWPFQTLPQQATLLFAFKGKNGQWNCYAKARKEQQQAIFYSVFSNHALDAKQNAIAEFITRANYGLILGNFELDYTDGEIRYKTSIDVEGDRLSPALIHNLVYTNVLTMDQYLPGLMAVLEQGISPEQAIALVEQSQPATSAESATESNPIDRLVW